MGAGVSTTGGSKAENGGRQATGLGDLPELCAAKVIMSLDAIEICRFAKLNRAFRGASSADFVWEAKLPKNYCYLMNFAASEEGGDHGEELRCKKDVYATLCKPIHFDGGTKAFWLDKRNGMVCMDLSSKSLVITGIDDRRYWNYLPTDDSRFSLVAYLQQIWWLEVVGEIDFSFPPGTYTMSFRLHLGKINKWFGFRASNTDQVHGWDKKPVRFQLSTSDGQHAQSECYIKEPGKWVLFHVGDFVAPDTGQPLKLKFSMAQIDCTHTKGGLCVDSVVIRPKASCREI